METIDAINIPGAQRFIDGEVTKLWPIIDPDNDEPTSADKKQEYLITLQRWIDLRELQHYFRSLSE